MELSLTNQTSIPSHPLLPPKFLKLLEQLMLSKSKISKTQIAHLALSLATSVKVLPARAISMPL
jgi:hypothetical protein